MKKFFTAMSLVLGLGLATAQHTAPAASTNTHQVAKTTKTAVKDVKAVKPATKPAMAVAKPATAPTAVKMKKDGTPDKRYKENKHLKADGTPDKRYKENK